MLFNSIEFLLFLPVVFAVYWLLAKLCRRDNTVQNLFTVLASYVFYGWWDWRFLLLIAFTTLCSYYGGLLIEKYEGRRRVQRMVSAANIAVNLLVLCYFKYCNFFGENFAALLRLFGLKADWVTLQILLPVGISFYTFQALSYTIDVYQHKIKATRDIAAFFAFISFFPQLVAGPIERAEHLLPQFLVRRSFDRTKAIDGLRQMLWGLFKKMVIADNCARAVDAIWADFAHQSGFTLLMGALLFTVQIYGDFSGYSDIAIGTARLFGIRLRQNFNFPYFSRNIAEFWRRWHISLTSWFRDYIYIPLGGSRRGRKKAVRNTFVIFFVSGLWHGADWSFVLWGLYHAALFFPLFFMGRNRRYKKTVAPGRLLPTWHELRLMLQTFVLVMFGWILFRSDSLGQAVSYIRGIFTSSLFDPSMAYLNKAALLFTPLMLVVEWSRRERQHGLEFTPGRFMSRHGVLRWGVYLALTVLILMFGEQHAQFIYFQF